MPLFFTGLFQVAEDSGCLKWQPRPLKASLIPFLDVTTDDLEKWLQDFVDTGHAQRYTSDGKEYIYLTDFHDWIYFKNTKARKPTVNLPAWIKFHPYKSNPSIGTYEYLESMFIQSNKNVVTNNDNLNSGVTRGIVCVIDGK